MSELWRLSATELADGYRSGAFTPPDALEACLAQVAVVQPRLNAMVVVDEKGARRAAEASRLRWAAGMPLSALDGIPISVKDNMHVEGQPTGWGSRLLKGFVARHDERPVARLRAAGAVLFGKTNLPEFAMQGYTSNAVSGTTRNPWDPALTPGGSSGGAVAAVAAGCGPLALATDGGGSIRRPASHCGLVGFKPSAGLVSRSAGLPEIFMDYEVAGAIGRSVQDVACAIGILAGAGLSGATPRKARILFVPRFADHPVDPGIAMRVKAAAAHFEALGHTVKKAAYFALAERVTRGWSLLAAVGLARMYRDASRYPEFNLQDQERFDLSLCGYTAQASLRHGLAGSDAMLSELLAEIKTLKRELAAVFLRHDFILTPATAALPWPADQSHPAEIAGQAVGPRGHAVFTALANAAGLPAVALPCGFVNGLPTGFQLIGGAGADAAVLAMSRQYEQAYPWASHWPHVPAVAEAVG